jgi:hypothetical protein
MISWKVSLELFINFQRKIRFVGIVRAMAESVRQQQTKHDVYPDQARKWMAGGLYL